MRLIQMDCSDFKLHGMASMLTKETLRTGISSDNFRFEHFYLKLDFNGN